MNAYEILIELEPRNIEIISINAETNTVTVDVTRSTFKDATMIERILFSNTGNLYHVETIEQKEDETMKTNTLTAEELALLEEPEEPKAYDYLAAVKADIREYLAEADNDLFCYPRGIQKIFDEAEPYVTGSANGSYYCSTVKACKALKGNKDILEVLCFKHGIDPVLLACEPEKADVFIRGCLYGEVFESVIADYMLNN